MILLLILFFGWYMRHTILKASFFTFIFKHMEVNYHEATGLFF